MKNTIKVKITPAIARRSGRYLDSSGCLLATACGHLGKDLFAGYSAVQIDGNRYRISERNAACGEAGRQEIFHGRPHSLPMNKPIALITGITGQDGSYLAELLLEKNYEVHGIVRRASTINTSRIDHIFPRLNIHYGDLADGSALARLLAKVQPCEIYNLAAQSHVRVSFDVPEYTADVTGVGAVRLLEAIREVGLRPRYYQASSSEMFGLVQEVPQRETTPFYPRSPYGCAKVFAYWTTVNYRESYGIHASNGILFNHESPRRGETFVTRKITKAVARIAHGTQRRLVLGNLDAKRDWGFAGDYVEGMWRMLQVEKPDDYVLATGQTNTVREFCRRAFAYAGMDWEKYVDFDERYLRPTEVDLLIGDASKAERQLGWKSTTSFEHLVDLMVAADVTAEGVKTYGE